jgi:hypothetical protein
MEWCIFPAAKRTRATPQLTSEAPVQMARPKPACSISFGCISRSIPAQAIAAAATRMSPPSTALAKYSALLCPHS